MSLTDPPYRSDLHTYVQSLLMKIFSEFHVSQSEKYSVLHGLWVKLF